MEMVERAPPRKVTASGKRVVKIAFFKPDETDRSTMNRVATWVTANATGKTYSHVELIFSDGSVTSITQNPGRVHYDSTRMLSSPRYRCFFELRVSPKEEAVMEIYAKSCAVREVGFNRCGMYWNFVPCCGTLFPVRKEGTAFFCSEYIVTLLQTIGLLAELDPAKTSPNDLYAAVKNLDGVKVGMNDKMFQALGPVSSSFLATSTSTRRPKRSGLKHK